MQAVAKPQPASRMTLASLKRGVIADHPKRILLYAPEGIGKTTFAAQSPSPIFICAEDGTAEFDIARFPEPRKWSEVIDAIRLLRHEKTEFRTLVFDTLDWLEPMLWAHICERDRQASIESYGYGKGYTAALEAWRSWLVELDALRAERKMQIILLAHTTVRTFKNPEGEDYDRYNLKVHEKAAGLVKEWCDAVLFANYETFASKESKVARGKGVSSGARLIFTERHAAYDAKNRFGLPDRLPLSWVEFERAAFNAQARIERVAELKSKIREALATLGETELTEKTEAWLVGVDKVGALNEALNRLVTKIANKENSQ